MKKIIATVIIVLAVMFTPQGVYADSEEQNNEYYDRLISEINEGLSFDADRRQYSRKHRDAEKAHISEKPYLPTAYTAAHRSPFYP